MQGEGCEERCLLLHVCPILPVSGLSSTDYALPFSPLFLDSLL
jgi:hypothetical protein